MLKRSFGEKLETFWKELAKIGMHPIRSSFSSFFLLIWWKQTVRIGDELKSFHQRCMKWRETHYFHPLKDEPNPTQILQWSLFQGQKSFFGFCYVLEWSISNETINQKFTQIGSNERKPDERDRESEIPQMWVPTIDLTTAKIQTNKSTILTQSTWYI